MKILIDCRPIEESRGGTSFYIQRLLQAMSRLDDCHQYTYYLLFRKTSNYKRFFCSLGPNFKPLPFPCRFSLRSMSFIVNHFLLGPWIRLKVKPSLCFFPYSQSPLFFFSPLVVAVHDLAIFKHTQWFPEKQLWAKDIITPLSFKRSRQILAVSQATKKDLMQIMPTASKKIKVIYEGVSSPLLSSQEMQSPKKIHSILKKFKIGNNFILFIGTLEPRKNLVRLLKAFYRLLKEKNNIQLVIAGQKGWKYKEIFKTYQRLNLQEKVIFTGFVSEEKKWILLQKSRLFVYPSLYEGFGLPVLEAQKAGVPVICGNRGSLPEITQGSALLVNPDSVQEIYQAMKKLLEDKTLSQRLIEQGRQNIQRFSWDKTAQETLEVFKKVLKTSRR